MTYKEALIQQMTTFAADPLARFVGYGLRDGKGANGTMKMVPNHKVVETTVAENLMFGMAQGLAMTGLRPLVFLERFDFIGNAFDALVNHLDKAKQISRGEWNPCVLIRVVVGNKTKPLFTGPTHVQDFTEAFRCILKMPVYRVTTPDEVEAAYSTAIREQRDGIGSSLIVEYKELL